MKHLKTHVRFSWENFCNEYGVYFVTTGPNVARGHVSIKCPFCGDADPSEHMGLSLDIANPAWGCWRNAEHRGRDPIRLVRELLGCSRVTAEQIVESLAGTLTGPIRTADAAPLPEGPLLMPDTFKPLADSGFGVRFARYLQRRGFGSDWEELSQQYDLRYCLIGDFKWRLIIPVYDTDGLVTWTGRSIQPSETLRYKTLSHMPNEYSKHRALRNIKETIYNADALQHGGKTLVVTEGPLDGLKVDLYAQPYAVRATCLFGTAITAAQGFLLARIAKKFERVEVLLDRDARTVSWKLCEELRAVAPGTTVVSRELPPGVKDPGDLTKDQVRELFR